jgi:hypothetical protein
MSKNTLVSLILGCVLGAGLALAGCDRARAPGGAASRTPEEAAARVHEILAGKEPFQRFAEFGELLPGVDPSAAPAIAEVFETSAVDSGDPELVLFGMWWAGHDPQAAFAWTASDWRARHANVIAAVVRIWAHTDPKAAYAAARGLPFANQRDLASDAAIAGWDESGQPGLFEALGSFNQIEVQQVSETIARRRVGTLGAEGALAWADALAEGPFRDMISLRVASAAAADKKGAPLVAEWARPRIAEHASDSNYPRRIGTRWVQHDPDAAFAWLRSLPAGGGRDDGIGETYRAWLRRNAPAAHAWIEKTAMEPWNEPAYAVYARAIAWERPKEAIELARRFTDESLRESTTVVIGQVWSRHDPAAADAWLAQADLPEHTRRTAKMAHNANPVNQGRMQKFRAGASQAEAAEE